MTAQQAVRHVSDVAAAISSVDRRRLDSALERLPDFRGIDYSVEDMPGGLTNRSYKVVPRRGEPVVARLSFGRSGMLAIDRRAECHNAAAAAQAGVGPPIMLCEPDDGVAVTKWIDARTLVPADLDDSTTLTRVAKMCRGLHTGPRFANTFDMFAVQEAYLEVVRERGFRLPPRYRDFMPVVTRLRVALGVRALETVPCHNDLLAANVLDDGDRLWLIDYEYSGNNDPCFELGNIWSEANLDSDRLDELVAAYFGTHSRSLTARARLFGLMSKYGWTLWAAIQAAVSEVGFDFWSWGMEKYDRAVAEFDGPDLARLIEDVQQPH